MSKLDLQISLKVRSISVFSFVHSLDLFCSIIPPTAAATCMPCSKHKLMSYHTTMYHGMRWDEIKVEMEN